MRDGRPSVTAQRVAAHRIAFDRLTAPFGDPSADEALARDVWAGTEVAPGDPIVRYLRARTHFFDRMVVDAIKHNVSQIVLIGAGYDGRPLRYARPGVAWWEVDHPDTQLDKRARLDRLGLATPHITFLAYDLESEGLAGALVESGFDPDAASLVCCEGVAAYLTLDALERLLTEVRAVAMPGTRLALSVSVTPASGDAMERRRTLHSRLAALGEPIVSSVAYEEARDLLNRTRWTPVKGTNRSGQAGLVVAVPI
jgi:methyltransferase (TIGR00027 family)